MSANYTASPAFWDCLAFTLREEGGDRLTKDDGGVTKYGIAQRYHPGVDVANLTYDEAADIYYQNYWIPLKCYEYPPGLSLAVFDSGVNLGPARVIQHLQELQGLALTGKLDEKTMKDLRAASTSVVLRLLELRLAHYDRAVALSPHKKTWIRGWRLRVLRCAIAAAELGKEMVG